MRALSDHGRELFRDWVLHLPENPVAEPPINLLDDDECSFNIPNSSVVAAAACDTKYDLASAISPHVAEVEALGVNRDCWPQIWDALALLFFESICPRNADRTWKPNRIEHYVYDPAYTVRHRHRIYGPVMLFRCDSESVRPFFKRSPSVLGDYEEQIGSRNEIAGNSVALKVIRNLYIENGTDRTIGGFTNRKKYKGFKKMLPVPGTLRRFVVLHEQLKRTYDLAGISYEGFVKLLPDEFRDWLEY